MSTTSLPEIVSPSLFNAVQRLRAVLMVICFSLFSGSMLLAQVVPDSTQKGGKSGLKNRPVVSADSTQTPTQPLIVLGKDTVPNDTTIGPVAKPATRAEKREARQKLKAERPLPDPKISVRRSLILPGLGQAYNRSWWKIPIVYGGFGAFVYFIADNHRQYKFFRDVAWCKNDSNPSCNADALYPDYAQFDINSMISERDNFRRFRDLNVILCAVWYTFQAVDAYVDAHLKGFNVSEDLSIRFKPTMNIDPFQRSNLYMGATLSIRLQR